MGMPDNEGVPVPHKSADGVESTKRATDAAPSKAWVADHHVTGYVWPGQKTKETGLPSHRSPAARA